MSSHNHITSVHSPYPYSLDLLHSAPEDALAPYYEMMDLSNILNLQDVMTITSYEDIPDLEDSFGLWIWTMDKINAYNPWTLSTSNNAKQYETRWICEP